MNCEFLVELATDKIQHQNAFLLCPWNVAMSPNHQHSDGIHLVSDRLIAILDYSGHLLEFGINRVWFAEHIEKLFAELKMFVLNVGSYFIEVLGGDLLHYNSNHSLKLNL